MMLAEVWQQRRDNRNVATRPGKLWYVALGHGSLAEAIEAARENQPITDEDMGATDWYEGAIEPHDVYGQPHNGTVKAIHPVA